MTFTFTQADIEKLIEDHLAKKNLKVVGKYHPNKHDNTVSVDVEEITPEVKTASQANLTVDTLQEFYLKQLNAEELKRQKLAKEGFCRQCISEKMGRSEKGICSCGAQKPYVGDPVWIR